MIKELEILSEELHRQLFKAPVLVSVLACCYFGKVNKSQKADAIKLAHLKTFTSPPILNSYYVEVEKNFKEEFETAVKKYFPFDEYKRNDLKKEIEDIKLITKKLDSEYAATLCKSLDKYALHVKKAAHNIMEDFIFPVSVFD